MGDRSYLHWWIIIALCCTAVSCLTMGAFGVRPFALIVSPIRLGVDLAGGVSVSVGVDDVDVARTIANEVSNAVRSECDVNNVCCDVAVGDFSLRMSCKSQDDALYLSSRLKHLYRDTLVLSGGDTEVAANIRSTAISRTKFELLGDAVDVLFKRLDYLGNNNLQIRHTLNGISVMVSHSGTTTLTEVRSLIEGSAQLEFRLVLDDVAGDIIDDRWRLSPAFLSGADLRSAIVVKRDDNFASVLCYFNAFGARKLANVTKSHIGDRVAVLHDNKLVQVATIADQISNGVAEISGHMTFEDATRLVKMLNSGALPVNLRVLSEEHFSPVYGKSLLSAGIKIILCSYLVIFVLLLARYGLLALIAALSMLVQLASTISMLSIMHSVVTFASIAGLALGVGMSVDGNILLFERMLHLRSRPSPSSLVMRTARDVLRTIFNSNLTTAAAFVVIFCVGEPMLRSFALTTLVGLLCSTIVAVAVNMTLVRALSNSRVRSLLRAKGVRW